jgi:hypothetical protein
LKLHRFGRADYRAVGGDGSAVVASLPAGEIVVLTRKRERSSQMIRKHFRFRRRIFVGLAFATLVAAPVAQGTTGFYVDGGPAPRSESQASQSYLRYHQYNPTAVVSPRKAIASEISVQPTLSQLQVEGMRWQAMADAYQRLAPVRSENSFGAPGPSSAGATGPQVVASVSGASSDGFNWNDAGIGASAAFGIALLLVISLALGRRNRDHTGLASA